MCWPCSMLEWRLSRKCTSMWRSTWKMPRIIQKRLWSGAPTKAWSTSRPSDVSSTTATLPSPSSYTTWDSWMNRLARGGHATQWSTRRRWRIKRRRRCSWWRPSQPSVKQLKEILIRTEPAQHLPAWRHHYRTSSSLSSEVSKMEGKELWQSLSRTTPGKLTRWNRGRTSSRHPWVTTNSFQTSKPSLETAQLSRHNDPCCRKTVSWSSRLGLRRRS